MRVFSYFGNALFFGRKDRLLLWCFPIFWVCLFFTFAFFIHFIFVIAFAFAFRTFVCMYILFNETANGFDLIA